MEMLTETARTIYDSTSYSDPRKLDNLPAFLKKQFGTLKPTSNKPSGAPHTIIVTASGIRAADVCRSLKTGLPKQGIKDPKVEKLFAKHLKLADQVASLKKNRYVFEKSLRTRTDFTCRVDYGVGTPDRLSALLEEKALSTENLKRVVIDVSYIDQKKRGILDMKDLHEALIKLLLRKEFLGEDKEAGDELFVFY